MLGNEDRMKISTKGRYAVRVMLDLALNNNGECIKVKEIAARQGISEKYLEQIIAVLNKAGFMTFLRQSRLWKRRLRWDLGISHAISCLG